MEFEKGKGCNKLLFLILGITEVMCCLIDHRRERSLWQQTGHNTSCSSNTNAMQDE